MGRKERNLFSNLLAKANEEGKTREVLEAEVASMARKIIRARDVVTKRKAVLRSKQEKLEDFQVENLGRLSRGVDEIPLVDKIDEIDSVTQNLGNAENYYYSLVDLARSRYPKFFIKRQQD